MFALDIVKPGDLANDRKKKVPITNLGDSIVGLMPLSTALHSSI